MLIATDALSRLPLPQKPKENLQPAELVFLTIYLEISSVSSAQKDPVLSTVRGTVHQSRLAEI